MGDCIWHHLVVAPCWLLGQIIPEAFRWYTGEACDSEDEEDLEDILAAPADTKNRDIAADDDDDDEGDNGFGRSVYDDDHDDPMRTTNEVRQVSLSCIELRS